MRLTKKNKTSCTCRAPRSPAIHWKTNSVLEEEAVGKEMAPKVEKIPRKKGLEKG